jgi:hypothetical protein
MLGRADVTKEAYMIIGSILGGVAAAIFWAAGLGKPALVGGGVVFLFVLFIGSISGVSIRLTKGIWTHHRRRR